MMMFGYISVLYCALCFFSIAAYPTKEACAEVKCPGPVKFYEDLKCRPIYANSDDCCAIKYECEHLKNRSPDKCYADGREYEIGEKLIEISRCDFMCMCTDWRNITEVACASIDYAEPVTDPGCYRERNATDCLPGPQICPEKPEDIPTCEVDGKTLQHGDYFVPETDKNKGCYCGPGFNGEYVAPYCKNYSDNLHEAEHCGTELFHRAELEEDCAPVFRTDQSPEKDCNIDWRCQNDKDEVIKKEAIPNGKEDITCKFGNLTMQIGDELNQDTAYESVCVKCICEVPPLPTCQFLPGDTCDNSKRNAFLN